MKSVLISIQPKWCELIASGKKTIEIRKSKPKLETPFKVYIYCTKDEPLYKSGEKFWCKKAGDFGNGKVIGEFVCDDIVAARTGSYCKIPINEAMIEVDDLLDYADQKPIYGWHISDLKIYDKPKDLSEFIKPCDTPFQCDKCNELVEHFGCGRTITRPPRSWCYVKSEE